MTKRLSLQISLLTVLVLPFMFALGWWARDLNYGRALNRLERTVAKLRPERQNDRVVDELRGVWWEMTQDRGGRTTRWSEVLEAGTPIEVQWVLAPEGGSQRSVLKGEVDTLDLGRFTLDTTRDPIWIDFHSRNGGQPFVCLGILRVRKGYTDFGTAVVALSRPSFDGVPERPISFESTPENEVSVYRLRRGHR
jgi:hypothetical protein